MHFGAIANSARGGPPRPPPVRDRVKSCLVFYTKNIGTKISSKKFLVKKKYWSKKLFCPKKIWDTKFFYWSQAAQFDFCQAQPQLNSTQFQLQLRLSWFYFHLIQQPNPPTHPATRRKSFNWNWRWVKSKGTDSRPPCDYFKLIAKLSLNSTQHQLQLRLTKL